MDLHGVENTLPEFNADPRCPGYRGSALKMWNFISSFLLLPRGGAIVKISKNEEYGIRLVMSLAATGGQQTIRELAASEGLPDTTVAKVIGRLRRTGLVEAARGRNGGYSLTRPAGEITLAEVVSTFDVDVFDSEFCDRMSPGAGGCARGADCSLKPVWRGLRTVIGNFLDNISVADVVAGAAPARIEPLPVIAPRRD
jgi:Rrf2 family protein